MDARGAVVVVGDGYIGSAVRRALVRRGVAVRRVVRSPAARSPVPTARADVTEPATLAGLFTGAAAVVVATTYLGDDPGRCRSVNTRGTASVVRAATDAGVGQVLYVSTAAVYGSGPARGAGVEDLVPRPGSAASRSRLAAEDAVRAAGGLVARPHLVHGGDDRWVGPAARAMVEEAGGRPEDPGALLSTTRVAVLGQLLAAMATASPEVLPPGSVWHADEPEPVGAAALLEALVPGIAAKEPLPRAELERRLDHRPDLVRLLPRLLEDHWYDSRPVWRALGLTPLREPARTTLVEDEEAVTHPAHRGARRDRIGGGDGRRGALRRAADRNA